VFLSGKENTTSTSRVKPFSLIYLTRLTGILLNNTVLTKIYKITLNIRQYFSILPPEMTEYTRVMLEKWLQD